MKPTLVNQKGHSGFSGGCVVMHSGFLLDYEEKYVCRLSQGH